MKVTGLENTFFGERLEIGLEVLLLDTNPWWQNEPMRVLPPLRRWLFEHTLQRLKNGLAPVTVLRGPRQVGKTTLQEHIIDHLLHREDVHPKRIFRVQFDEIPSLTGLRDPILSLCRWFERQILGGSFNEWARRDEPVFLFFDEVQNLTDWAPQIKTLVDHHSVRVLLTGSSALRIEYGRDSLAGRITTLELGTFLLREIASLRGWGELTPPLPLNGLGALKERDFWETLREFGDQNRRVRDQAFVAFAERGGYPIAQVHTDRPWEEVADQLNETVIRRVIQHDLRLGERGRKRDPNLLETLFLLSCRYAGQAPGPSIFINEIRSALSANIGPQRVRTYLRFLNDTLLIRLVPPLELRLKRQKGYPKICLCDHGLRASWLREVVPLTPNGLQRSPHLSDLAGHMAESIVGSFLGNIPGLDLAWFPERDGEPEVDFVITIGEHRIPLEIKYRQRIDGHRDTLGLRAFMEKVVYNAPFGVLVTLSDDVSVTDPRIVAVPLSSLLLMR
ncbi:MAG: ATP-binding protein [Candidatus Latescibacteria bacterium]|nr:ATP-binding protein [Candidatus Latescibacterota bacterium]